MRPALLLALAIAAALAGCSDPATTPESAAANLPDEQPEAAPAIEVYRHDALVVGVGIPTPFGPAVPAPWPVPPAKVEHFTLAVLSDLTFEAQVCSGNGMAGFEVVDAAGAVVWSSHFRPRADTVGACRDLDAKDGSPGPFAPGEYEVRVLVGGAMEPELVVWATPAPPVSA